MGKGEIKRPQNQLSRNAQEANNVSRCEKENRCRATSSMGKGKGCEEITEESRIVPIPDNGLGFFVPACMGIAAYLFGYLDNYRKWYGVKAALIRMFFKP